jgi:hypothetical protein
MLFICADKHASSLYVFYRYLNNAVSFTVLIFFIYLKLAVMVQSHEEEEQVTMNLPLIRRSADPSELEDVPDFTYEPKKKDIMKVPLIPDTTTSDSQ